MHNQKALFIAALLLSFLPIFGQESPSAVVSGPASENASAPGTPKTIHPAPASTAIPGNPGSTDTIAAEQEPPVKFEIGECIQMDEKGNLVIFFNCLGRIVEQNCAVFYRKGKMDSTHLSLAGTVEDYYTNDTLALKARIENSLLNGPATYFHRNGKIHAKGRYSENTKTGVWTYFYENGNPEKIINFVRGFPFIVTYHQRNGKQRVVQGNGKYRDRFMLGNSCSPYEIRGRVVEGKMHGKWKIYTGFNHQKIAVEFYDHGKFIKRESRGETFTDQPIINIHGFFPNESLLWTENIAGCAGGHLQALSYKGQDLHAQFYAELLDSLNTLVLAPVPEQWLIAGIQIARNNLVHSVQIKSSIEDKETETRIYTILKSMIYFSINEQIGNGSDASLLFTILFRNGSVIIPADIYYKEWMKALPKVEDSGENP